MFTYGRHPDNRRVQNVTVIVLSKLTRFLVIPGNPEWFSGEKHTKTILPDTVFGLSRH